MEERKQRLSDVADRADKLARVQAEDQAKKRIPDDEETEDEEMSSKSNNFSGKRRRSAMPRLLTDWRD